MDSSPEFNSNRGAVETDGLVVVLTVQHVFSEPDPTLARAGSKILEFVKYSILIWILILNIIPIEEQSRRMV